MVSEKVLLVLQIVNITVDKGTKRVWLKELEEINQCSQAENEELRRLLWVAEEENQELQERS